MKCGQLLFNVWLTNCDHDEKIIVLHLCVLLSRECDACRIRNCHIEIYIINIPISMCY